jgi:hypothetical protein
VIAVAKKSEIVAHEGRYSVEFSRGERTMSSRFEYGVTRIKDLQVKTRTNEQGKILVESLELDGRRVQPSSRFWTSLHVRFGFTANIFRYFSHAEVFERISQVAPDDKIRWCLEGADEGPSTLLAVTSPTAASITYDGLMELLDKYGTQTTRYRNGVVASEHSPRLNPIFQVGGDGFQNKFILDTPIDGYGRPSVYLSMLRLICSNGMVGYTPAFRSELSIGKGENGVSFVLERVLDGFNNEDGYAALRQRFESATRSWASVHEANQLYKTLTRLHAHGEVPGQAVVSAAGGDGARLCEDSPLFSSFHRMTGDLSRIYGLANVNTLSAKRQRTLPTACKVYDLLNFASEVATHHAGELGNRMMQAYLGELISGEFDLEGTVDQFSDWRDFFIGNEQTASTMAEMNRRSR